MLSFYRPQQLMNQIFGDLTVENNSTFVPRTNIIEKADQFILKADLPGMEEKDIKLEIEDGYLSISGERVDSEENKDDQLLRSETVFGKFQRSFKLGREIDETGIEAHYKNGVLTVVLPKSSKVQKKLISIN